MLTCGWCWLLAGTWEHSLCVAWASSHHGSRMALPEGTRWKLSCILRPSCGNHMECIPPSTLPEVPGLSGAPGKGPGIPLLAGAACERHSAPRACGTGGVGAAILGGPLIVGCARKGCGRSRCCHGRGAALASASERSGSPEAGLLSVPCSP